MRIVLTGAQGQLGRALQTALSYHQVIPWTHQDHDIGNPDISDQLLTVAPDMVINAAAWTNVDGAEAEPTAAYAVNALGPLYLAQACARCGAAMVQISSNEVFAGTPGTFYREYDQPHATGSYARSKLAGETALLPRLGRLYIVRVAWLYGPGGHNFPAKIAQAADRNGALRVVCDEHSNPTYAPDVAQAVVRLVETDRYGIYHLVNEGYASRFEWAKAILAGSNRSGVPITPISQAEWPRPVSPPAHAVLVNQAAAALGIVLRPWQLALAEYLAAQKDRII